MKLHFGEAWGIFVKTTPYVVLRIVVYGVLGVGAGLFLGFFLLLSKVFGGGGGVLFLLGVVALVGILKLVQRYALYLIKAGHIAVITELIHKGKLPDGVGQVEYGKQVVTGLFKEVSVLFAVDQLVSGILKGFNRAAVNVTEMIPIPGLDALAKIATTILNFAVTYVDESILSYNLSRPGEGIWESAKRGVILYAQNWKSILTAAFWIAVVNVAGLAALVVVALVPFGLLAMMTASGTLKFFWLVMAVTTAYGLKLSIVNPFCLVAMIKTYNEAVRGQEPDPQWEERLQTVSGKFRELRDKAGAAAAGGFRPAPGPGAAA